MTADITPDITPVRRHNDVALAVRQFRFEFRSFWRNPPAAFFTFAFPLMFMVIFNLLFDDPYTGRGPQVSASTFFTPAIIALSLVSACFTNVAIGTVFARDQGILKRVRGTPLPAWVYLSGRISSSVVVATLLVVIVGAFGALAYDVTLPTTTLAAAVVTLVVAAACFCALGLAVTAIVPNADAAPAVVNAIILPLLFISDVFIPLESAPGWLQTLAGVFPVKHLSNSLLEAFIHPSGGSGFVARDLIVMAAWAVGGTLIASRTFLWETKRPAGHPRTHGRANATAQ